MDRPAWRWPTESPLRRPAWAWLTVASWARRPWAAGGCRPQPHGWGWRRLAAARKPNLRPPAALAAATPARSVGSFSLRAIIGRPTKKEKPENLSDTDKAQRLAGRRPKPAAPPVFE